MDFRPLTTLERNELINALKENRSPEDGGRGLAILMDRRTTRFVGTSEEITDEEVITAIKSVPCHY